MNFKLFALYFTSLFWVFIFMTFGLSAAAFAASGFVVGLQGIWDHNAAFTVFGFAFGIAGVWGFSRMLSISERLFGQMSKWKSQTLEIPNSMYRASDEERS
jgi:hypothetical protein